MWHNMFNSYRSYTLIFEQGSASKFFRTNLFSDSVKGIPEFEISVAISNAFSLFHKFLTTNILYVKKRKQMFLLVA